MSSTSVYSINTPGAGCNLAVQTVGTGKLGMTIDEAADCTGIGRNTLRKLVSWGKIPVLRIGRKTIIRADVINTFMEINQGRDLLDCTQVRQVN